MSMLSPIPTEADTPEVFTDKRPLVEYLERGNKPKEAWRIGTEHEKFVYQLDDYGNVPYEGESGIGALLTGLTRY